MRMAPYIVLATLMLATTARVCAAVPAGDDSCACYAPEAASRSGISIEMILRVMGAESGGNPRAVSRKGAIGCMQIMPATWRALSVRYDLGSDPFDARRNMIGGAMYLAELVSRYGLSGAIAAYNAGPGRYERYVAGSAPLPAETIAYRARIQEAAHIEVAVARPPRWQEASLFLQESAVTAAPGNDVGRLREPNGELFPLSQQPREELLDTLGR